MTRPSRITGFALVLFAASVLCAADYRGNTESHVFHQESCRYYTCKNCTVRFSSADEAIERGYRPCGTCKNCTAKFSTRDEAVGAGYSPGGCCKP